ncbi:MAG: hypothetical protein AB7I27_09535 [Bacteriovoracaceae bacterium]
MKHIFKGIAIFCVLLVVTTISMDVFHTEFGTVDFFQKHGWPFLIFITIFPRLTLLFSSVVSGGFFWWLGFIFVPRILVAILATIAYFHTNPILVVISWLVALGGEFLEKWGIGGRKKFVFRTVRMGSYPYEEPIRPDHTSIQKDDAIEAEFTKKS